MKMEPKVPLVYALETIINVLCYKLNSLNVVLYWYILLHLLQTELLKGWAVSAWQNMPELYVNTNDKTFRRLKFLC